MITETIITKNSGWGAYQNKKKEIEKIKTQLVVQKENNYGERIKVDKNNNFKNIKTPINPFRFPNNVAKEDKNENYRNRTRFRK